MPNKVEILIDGKNQGAIRSIQGVEQRLGGLSTVANRMQSMLGGLQSKLLLMGTAAVTSFGYLIKNAIDTAESIEKMSQRIGVSTEFLSTFRHATELAGTNIDVMEKAIARLSRNLYDANRGLLDSKLAFQQLGVSVTDSNGNLRNSEEVIYDVADKFQQMQDGSLKTAMALKIFGKSGADLIPLLNSGAEGIKAMQEEARALGLEIDTNTAKQAALLKDNMTRLENSVKGTATVVASELLPSLVTVSNAMVTASGGAETLRENLSFVGDIIKGVATAGSFAMTNFITIWTAAIGLVKYSAEVFQFDFEEAGNVFSETIDNIGENYSRFASFVGQLWSVEVPGYAGALAGLENIHKNLNVQLGVTNENLEKMAESNYWDLYDKMQALLNDASLDEEGMFNPLRNVSTGAVEYTDRARAAMSDYSDFFIANQILMSGVAQDTFGNMGQAMMNFYELSGKASKGAFGAFKAFAIAETLAATYAASMKIFEAYSIIPWYAYAQAGAVIALGLTRVAQIASLQPGSTGGGGGGGVPSAPPPSSVVNNNNSSRNFNATINVYTSDPNFDKDRFARDILGALRKAENDGG